MYDNALQVIDEYEFDSVTEKSGRLWISIGSTAFVQVTSAGLLFLIGLVTARLLGPVGLGAYEFVDAWLEILILFAMLGFDRFTDSTSGDLCDPRTVGTIKGHY